MSIPIKAKVRISAVVPKSIRGALDAYKKSAGLKSRSAAAAEALRQWAEEYQREARVAEAVARYGSAYAKDAELETTRAEGLSALIDETRKSA